MRIFPAAFLILMQSSLSFASTQAASQESFFCGKSEAETQAYAAQQFNTSKDLTSYQLGIAATDFGASVKNTEQELTLVGLKVNQETGKAYAVTASIHCSDRNLGVTALAVVPKVIR